MAGFGGFEPVGMDSDLGFRPQGNGKNPDNSDNLMMGLLGAAVAFFALYFIIKAGVKNGILEVLEEGKFPFPPPPCDCR